MATVKLRNSNSHVGPAHLQHETRFPRANSANTLEPVSTNFMPLTINKKKKTFIFQLQNGFLATSNANFTNLFIFSDSSCTKDHFGDTFSGKYPLLMKIEIAPRK